MDEDRSRLGFRIGFSVGSRQGFGVYSLINESSARTETVKYFMCWLHNYSLQQAAWSVLLVLHTFLIPPLPQKHVYKP